MKNRISLSLSRLLLLIRIDAQRVFERIKYRESEYMHTFSLKRTRDHFDNIFKNRYEELSINELRECSEEVIAGLDEFYTSVDDMCWYLNNTEDMPGTINDTVESFIRNIEDSHQKLQLYISAEFELQSEEESRIE